MTDGDFVTVCVKRFDALARLDCDVEETEHRLFDLIDQVRRQAKETGQGCDYLVRQLEILAHDAEVPRPDAREVEDQSSLLRYAGVMRRAADLLGGPEKDLTPRQVSDEAARPGR